MEPLIALSIIFVRHREHPRAPAQAPGPPRPRDRRALLAFVFGFVHGFGFASVLRDFGLPQGAMAVALVSFNLGVEIGQASIVLVAAPLLAALRRASAPGPGGAFAFAGSACGVRGGRVLVRAAGVCCTLKRCPAALCGFIEFPINPLISAVSIKVVAYILY